MAATAPLHLCIFFFVLLSLVSGAACSSLHTPRNGIKCCARRSKILSVGKDAASGDVINVDVGECKNRCHHHHHHQPQVKKERFQQLLRENSHLSPEEVYRAERSRLRRTQTCGDGEDCFPSSTSRVSYMMQEGNLNVTITEACSCEPAVRECVRRPQWVTFHEGTPLQTSVDVGACEGPCSVAGDGCRATHTRTMALTGPNGAECVSVVEECSCVGSCYRAAHLLHIYNFTAHSGGWTGGGHHRTIEVIDVGTCVGDCSTSDGEGNCVYESSGGDCLMSLQHREKTCSAATHEVRSYHSHDGMLKTLNVVKDCECS